MKKNVWAFGLVAGLISSIGFLFSAGSHDTVTLERGMLYGFASMILGFSLTFVAVKNYRDKYNSGIISFRKAFKIGMFIALIASTVYVVAWLIDYYFFIGDSFWDYYAQATRTGLESKGATEQEITASLVEIESWKEMYKNPLLAGLITYTEILPVGIFTALIAAAILQRKNPKQLQTTTI
jgi:hypothetical protein